MQRVYPSNPQRHEATDRHGPFADPFSIGMGDHKAAEDEEIVDKQPPVAN